MKLEFGVQYHTYHLVDPSPWPLVTSISVMSMLIGGVMYMHSIENGLLSFFFGFLSTLVCTTLWWRDVIREGSFEGRHTIRVQKSLRMGMIFFILSEVMFFFGFFWAFFHSSLAPTVELGSIWPPAGIEPFNPWAVPSLNTAILLLSGVTCTWVHAHIVSGNKKSVLLGFDCTIFLALLFTALQAFEYSEAQFSISDGVYGSTFYLATGFHGVHVIIGTLFLSVCMLRVYFNQFEREHHFGFEAAAWYWHFVDVVWLFLFVTIYWWGSL